MPIVSVKQLSLGAKLAEDVHTPLGGLLFPKGTVIEEKEREFLLAFQIIDVSIDEEREEKPSVKARTGKRDEQQDSTAPSAARNVEKTDIIRIYDKAVEKFRSLMLNVQAGADVPVLEVRQTITPLLEKVKERPDIAITMRKVTNAEQYLYEHAIAVGLISFTLAKWLNLPENEWMQVALAGTLVDIGKTKIDPRILWKPGKLTAEEFEEMKRHTIYGYQLIKQAKGVNEGVALAALQHHEREDGSGYPLGLVGKKLHLYSKIVAVADVYHAMCSNRLHQEAISPYLVVEQLITDSFGKLDPTIVHTFVSGITRFSVGTVVELSDGRIGKIVYADRNNPTRPMVETNDGVVNLQEARHLFIRQVM
ncbi:MAG: HD-GYP domain-containing protein [Brevibacillus sp.]|nr:HD-GYP domain-containing protein [Brevibacillus sp.]